MLYRYSTIDLFLLVFDCLLVLVVVIVGPVYMCKSELALLTVQFIGCV